MNPTGEREENEKNLKITLKLTSFDYANIKLKRMIERSGRAQLVWEVEETFNLQLELTSETKSK